MIEIITRGDIFESNAQTLVNTVNCLGVMGKGLALQFKKRYPAMFLAYERICKNDLLQIGKLWIYKTDHRWILNFPTKYDWRQPSKEEYLELGLQNFLESYKDKGITSVAFPLLGASNGGLDPAISLKIMRRYLEQCDIPVYIYLSYKSENAELFDPDVNLQ
jgi:O-acetyl-ADP-ribose deacetylase (regulator of RNase III)